MTQATRACAHCGAQHQRTKAKYCTELCARRAYSQARTADGRHAAYRSKPEVKERFLAWKQDNYDRYRHDRTCVACGTTWRTQHKDGKYCSMACRDHVPHVPLRQRAEQKAAQAMAGSTGRTWISGPCLRCGTAYVMPYFNELPKWCSERCSEGASHDRRRAREQHAYVEDIRRDEVFERDGWICYLCDRPIDRDAPAPDPWSPSIDHVIALANGGEHSMANVRAAHMLCNSIKSNRTIKGLLIHTT